MDYRKAWIYTWIGYSIIVAGLLIYLAYQTGIEQGRLQGLECGTDTECEVLEDMLSR